MMVGSCVIIIKQSFGSMSPALGAEVEVGEESGEGEGKAGSAEVGEESGEM